MVKLTLNLGIINLSCIEYVGPQDISMSNGPGSLYKELKGLKGYWQGYFYVQERPRRS